MIRELPPPADIVTERLVLGSVLVDEALMSACRPVLTGDDFSLEFHRRIWRHACSIYDGGGRVDLVTVFSAIHDAGEAQHDTLSALTSLNDGMPVLKSLDTHLSRLREESMRRRIMTIADSMHKRAASHDDPQAILDSVVSMASDMAAEDPQAGLITARELVDRVGLQHILAPRIQRGLEFPWPWMTACTCGMLHGELWVLAAHTSCGKTSAALQVAIKAAMKGKRVAVFSLEMGAESLYSRATYQLAGVDSERGKRGQLDGAERERVNQAAGTIYELPILFSQKSSFTALEIHAELRRERTRGPFGLIVIDYLQLLSDGGRHENRAQAVGAAARACKLMAGEFDAPVLLLSQFSRESAKPDKIRKPVLTDLKESGDIENHANGVWFIHRETTVDLEMVPSEFILAKQRDGRRNISWNYWFQPSMQVFTEKDTHD